MVQLARKNWPMQELNPIWVWSVGNVSLQKPTLMYVEHLLMNKYVFVALLVFRLKVDKVHHKKCTT